MTANKLFKIDYDKWWENAILNHPSWSKISHGFKMLSDIGADHACEGKDQDILIYPIIFLYRHYLELQLKGLIRQFSKLIREKPSSRLMRTHDLEKLLEKLIEMYELYSKKKFDNKIEDYIRPTFNST
jgi:hypothetical protein